MVVVFWEYRPSDVAAYAFMSLFALATLVHIVFLVWFRAWSFIPFIAGGICKSCGTPPLHPPPCFARPGKHPRVHADTHLWEGEIFGYYERAKAHDQPTILGPWILQDFLLLVAPPTLAASVYMSFGRIVMALDARDRAICFPRFMTKIYVLIDIICIFTQLIGAVLPASGTASGRRLSKIIVLAGLLVQLVVLLFFIMNSIAVHRRLKERPVSVMHLDPAVRWLGYLWVIEVAAVMLIIRSIVRGAEFMGGTDGFVSAHEAFIYVFDAVPMLEVMVGFVLLYPPRLVKETRQLKDIVPQRDPSFVELVEA